MIADKPGKRKSSHAADRADIDTHVAESASRVVRTADAVRRAQKRLGESAEKLRRARERLGRKEI